MAKKTKRISVKEREKMRKNPCMYKAFEKKSKKNTKKNIEKEDEKNTQKKRRIFWNV